MRFENRGAATFKAVGWERIDIGERCVTGEDNSGGGEDRTDPTDIQFVGPSTAEVLEEAPFDADGIARKSVSYEMLVEAGVNPGVAGKLRREHSLAWSLGTTEDNDGSLRRRSDRVRGLQDDERAWVAASTGDWEETTDRTAADEAVDDETAEDAWREQSAGVGATDVTSADQEEEAAWRERSKPEPITEIEGIGEAFETSLAEAGITSVRSLATANPDRIAEALDLDAERVREWCDRAEERL